MKKTPIGLRILKSYIKWSLSVYTQKISVINPPKAHPQNPVIYASTHQNTLLDPLLLIPLLPAIPYSLTRGDVFNKKWVKRVLYSLRMRPVFRIRDGYSSVRKNGLNVFSDLSPYLADAENVLFFAEADNNINPVLRPIKKGVIRIAECCPIDNPPVVYGVRLSWSHPVYSRPAVQIQFTNPIEYSAFEELPDKLFEALNGLPFYELDSTREGNYSFMEKLTQFVGLPRDFTGLIRWAVGFVVLPLFILLSLFILALTLVFI